MSGRARWYRPHHRLLSRRFDLGHHWTGRQGPRAIVAALGTGGAACAIPARGATPMPTAAIGAPTLGQRHGRGSFPVDAQPHSPHPNPTPTDTPGAGVGFRSSEVLLAGAAADAHIGHRDVRGLRADPGAAHQTGSPHPACRHPGQRK